MYEDGVKYDEGVKEDVLGVELAAAELVAELVMLGLEVAAVELVAELVMLEVVEVLGVEVAALVLELGV